MQSPLSPEIDVLAIGNPALDATRPVRVRPERAVRAADKRVVVARAGDLSPTEARADLKALRGGDGEHRVRERRLQLVEHRLAEPRRRAADHARDRPADAVLGVLCTDDALEVVKGVCE
jgi:hypothetical protein